MDLKIKIGEFVIPNPVCVASGTFGYGSEYKSLVDFNSIGAIFSKVITLNPRPGNAAPRIVEVPSGLLNSIGMANVGVKKFMSSKLPFLTSLPSSIIVNIGGSVEDEYREIVETLESVDGIWGYEINISCPNVAHGGLAFGTDPTQVEAITSMLRKTTGKPLIIKLTPNVTDITSIARAAENGGADAVSCINTLMGMAIDIHKKQPVLPAGFGGLSGPAIRSVGVAMTYRVCRAVSIPVFGIGGISSAEDAIQYLLAGASAVQLGTVNFVDPSISKKVLDGIIRYAEEENLSISVIFTSFFPNWSCLK